MSTETIQETTSQTIKEQLAGVQHEIWAHWMQYLFSCCTFNDDGTTTMPADKVSRWLRQANLEYSALSKEEKESYRHQSDTVIAVLNREIEFIQWRHE
jgi:hypothetical protein